MSVRHVVEVTGVGLLETGDNANFLDAQGDEHTPEDIQRLYGDEQNS